MNDDDDDQRLRFEQMALQHLDAGYNLARWLTRNEHDAQDVVQEAWLRAMRYHRAFRGDQFRPWWLTIVRHTCYSWIRTNRPAELVAQADADEATRGGMAPESDEPQEAAMRNADRAQINTAIAALPVCYREVLVLRELEDLSYRDIARIADLPIGTVMSRLSRARGLLRDALSAALSDNPRGDARPALKAVPAPVRRGAVQ